MVKQKIVIKLSIENARKRTKALRAAVGIVGITSTSVDGDNLVVEGDGIDSITLTTVLRKKLGYADLISVTSGDEKKEEKKEEKSGGDNSAQPVIFPYYYALAPAYPHHYAYEVTQSPSICSIM